MERIGIRLVGLTALLALTSCGGDNPISEIANGLAEQCGIDVKCEGAGLAEGNASISGVASIDAFFQSVVDFEGRANAVSSGIQAELDAIRADFGIEAGTSVAAGLKAQIDANVEGSLEIQAEPARCSVDAMATLEAQAKCEGMASPGSAMVACEGGCEVEASANVMCDADAELKCTVTAPSVACDGECTGTCEADFSAAAECSGTCRGSCDGTCEVMNTQGECQGKCDGMCQGTCDIEVAAEANCSGTCKGECTVTNPSGGCEGGIRAECEAMAGAMVMCDGRCTGKVEPPMVSAECQASAKAEASLNVECTPPRLAVNYRLAANLDAAVQARFEAALTTLVEARLPRLLASLRKADLIIDAGADLSSSATGAVKGAINGLDGGANLRVVAGLNCALKEVGAVGGIITSAGGELKTQVSAAGEVVTMLGV